MCALFTTSIFRLLNLRYLLFRRRQWQPTPVLLPGKSHAWRSLVCCSRWGHEKSDTTEQLHFHFSLSCIGEGNGSPLQCSCLENPRDGGAWWAVVSGVAQSRTRLSDFTFTFHFHALEKEMATHCSVLAWRIPGMGETGGKTHYATLFCFSLLCVCSKGQCVHILETIYSLPRPYTKCFYGMKVKVAQSV